MCIRDRQYTYQTEMQKHMFLKNIVDPAYATIVEILASDDRKTYEDCLNEIRRKASDLDVKGRSKRQINKSSQNHKKNSNNKKNDIEKPTKRDDRNTNAVQQNKFSLSKEAWAALSQEQRDMWKNLQRSHKDANKTIKNTDKRKSHLSQSNSTDSEDTTIPTSNVNAVFTPKISPFHDDDDNDDDDETFQRASSLVRSAHVTRTVFLSPSLIFSSSISSSPSFFSNIVDGGCDTCVCGAAWKIIATTERRVNVEGFSSVSYTHLTLPTIA